jgi:hypothetical protein
MAKILKADPEWLFSGEGEPPKPITAETPGSFSLPFLAGRQAFILSDLAEIKARSR